MILQRSRGGLDNRTDWDKKSQTHQSIVTKHVDEMHPTNLNR